MIVRNLVMKNTLIILANTIVGTLTGSALGFFIPFLIAHIRPEDGPALSFIPIIGVPAGAIVGGVAGIIIGIYKVRRENLIREMLAPPAGEEVPNE